MYFLVFIVSSRIINATAVKNKSTTISAGIIRNSLFVRKTADLNQEWSFFIRLDRCKAFNHLAVYAKCQHPVEFRHNNTHAVVFNKPPKIIQSQWYTGKKLCFSFKQT